jgi:hypothetical protein
MGEKISHAVAPDYKKIKTTGTYAFTNAKMSLFVQSISDSAFVRVEHNYTAPDGFKSSGNPYVLSPNHYWKVDGILPSLFKAKATINYDGRTLGFSGNYWLDNNLVNTYEDSLVLMYRKNAGDEWSVFPYYTKNMVGNNNDKRGIIYIDTMKLGEYVFAMKDYTLGIQGHAPTEKLAQLKVFPNPAKDILTIEWDTALLKSPCNSMLTISDLSGKIIYQEKLCQHKHAMDIDTSTFSSGMYTVSIRLEGAIIAKNKFVVAH